MTIYVDAIVDHAGGRIKEAARPHGTRWCHMFSDEEDPALPELHAFARRIGLQRGWFQDQPRRALCHYDLVPSKRALAVRAGAREIATREWARRTYTALLAEGGDEARVVWLEDVSGRRFVREGARVSPRRDGPVDDAPSSLGRLVGYAEVRADVPLPSASLFVRRAWWVVVGDDDESAPLPEEAVDPRLVAAGKPSRWLA